MRRQELAARFVLESVSLFPDGAAELAFGDGGAFSGHLVLVSVAEDGSFEDADLAG